VIAPRLACRFLPLLAAGLGAARAATVELAPVADTTLIEAAPGNNLGGQGIVNAGSTATLKRNRGLFRFEPAAALPAGARVTAATLILEVTGEPPSPAATSSFSLHRVLRAWGEGAGVSVAGAPGLGETATAGEATWTHRFALTADTWASPGAGAGEDYVTAGSASVFVYGTDESPYRLEGAGLAADVQAWLDEPATNFGWILIAEAEATAKTARRFGAREDPAAAPLLIVTYDDPPRLDRIAVAGTAVQLEYTAPAGQATVVESRNEAGGDLPWATVTNVPPPAVATPVVVTTPASGPRQFYRLRLP
jgi:hypothetical protein